MILLECLRNETLKRIGRVPRFPTLILRAGPHLSALGKYVNELDFNECVGAINQPIGKKLSQIAKNRRPKVIQYFFDMTAKLCN